MALRGEDPKSYGTLSEDKVEEVEEEEEVRPSQTVSVRRQHRAVVIFSAVVVGLVLLSLIIAVVYKQTRPEPSQPSPAGPGLYGEYEVAAVASDGAPCAKMAGDILREDGTAVDAAVAALVCNGVYNSHSMGLGGGFLLTFYNRSVVRSDLAHTDLAHTDLAHCSQVLRSGRLSECERDGPGSLLGQHVQWGLQTLL